MRSAKAYFLVSWCFLLVSLGGGTGFAALVVNPPQPLDRRLEVQIIQVANDDGSSPAPLFGTSVQAEGIFALVDTIWAQAGIDVSFKFRLSPYLDTFSLVGNAGSGTRPSSDLGTIRTDAAVAGGILDPDPKVVNLFMVQTVPGFNPLGPNSTAGLAFIGANGIAMWVGPNLPTFASGVEVIAGVLAHELGHNLGLNHILEEENLMQSSSSGFQGERLSAAQIAMVRNSSLLVTIPEPSTALLALLGLSALAVRRHRVSCN